MKRNYLKTESYQDRDDEEADDWKEPEKAEFKRKMRKIRKKMPKKLETRKDLDKAWSGLGSLFGFGSKGADTGLSPYNKLVNVANVIPAVSMEKKGKNLVVTFRDEFGARSFLTYIKKKGKAFRDGKIVFVDYKYASQQEDIERTPLKTEATTTANIATFMTPIAPPMTRSPLRFQGYEHGGKQPDLCKKCKKRGYICPECRKAGA